MSQMKSMECWQFLGRLLSVTINIVSAGSNCFAVESATHGMADPAVLVAL